MMYSIVFCLSILNYSVVQPYLIHTLLRYPNRTDSIFGSFYKIQLEQSNNQERQRVRRMFLSYFRKNAPHPPLTELYSNPNVVSCVFRALDELSKILVLRIMKQKFNEQTLPLLINNDQDSKTRLQEAVAELESLDIIRKSGAIIITNQRFRASLEKFIIQPEVLTCVDLPDDFVDELSVPLHQLLNNPPTETIRRVLMKANLIDDRGDFTKNGFRFFLSDTSTQICEILHGYARLKDNLLLWEKLIEISILDPDKAYQVNPERWPMQLIDDLVALKFIRRLSVDGVYYIRTNRVFWNFAFEQPTIDLTLNLDIIVETNFKVYAHIKSKNVQAHAQNYEVLKRVLKLFIQLDHPNFTFHELIVGTLKEDSVKRAYRLGISSHQILEFFRKNTDPARLLEAEKKGQVANKQDAIYSEKREKLKFLKLYSKDERDIIPNNLIQELRSWESEAQKVDIVEVMSEEEGFD